MTVLNADKTQETTDDLPDKPDRRPDVPKTWRPEYANVLRLDVLGATNQDIADALRYSKGHVKRIKGMPEYKAMKEEILRGESGDLIERTRTQLTLMLGTAAEVYHEVMTDENAHNRAKISAADSVMDRFLPKRSRAEVEAHVDSRVIEFVIPGPSSTPSSKANSVCTSPRRLV